MRAAKVSLGWMMALASVGIAGCGSEEGPDLGTVTGIVTLDGQPLDNATIWFMPVEGNRRSIGKTDGSGQYKLFYTRDRAGAELGAHKVSITSEFDTPVNEATGEPAHSRPEMLPARYHEQTELTADVDKGSNTFNFDLTSK
ncbi:hypothetical protein Pan216_15420 [Planctomycetes bacterium Pan216]|uniref:Carboxypeptidase regulatory-like domain-containing protein n=1 Tax=Kolteria novifilia TaxID=2527975 RepID=A0A518B138_9BACT|nr:hypothetical protein Pan216_15420 [Planctomycetes bacterium Pan216]